MVSSPTDSIRRAGIFFIVLFFLQVVFLFLIAIAMLNRSGLNCCGCGNNNNCRNGFNNNNGADIIIDNTGNVVNN